ncbi:signal peptidase I [Prosthecobacter vanneervenii]|uniref:Signal peptidase I n=1 Tax=Prosthecobacter vanneervenii TaxID=48466 RepID=A0A7W8DJB2_9BACT|nr:signal peptidase I [Prosthecobacter vanneervenii]MBB5031850.1 signal peptidase I [Prosthecobacter vanneervenii]
MFFLTPRYLKHAKLLHKGVTRFINYKRDVLPPAKLDEICALRTRLEDAMRARDKAQIAALNDEINKTCEKALPHEEHSDIGENVEVFFVAIVIALGIRSYVAQPFKIPTGSMQPTLYGLVANHTEKDVTPNPIAQVKDWVAGRSYYNVVAKRSGWLRRDEPLTEHSFLGFFTHCRLHFEDGGTQWIWAPMRQLATDPDGFNLGLRTYLNLPMSEAGEKITPDARVELQITKSGGTFITEGQLLARGTLDTGDHVLVNKFAYNFRSPKRGEVFVFTTKNIRSAYMNIPPEQGSQHYIKRLVGVPGDKLEVKSPVLWINGKPAEEFGMKRVGGMQGDYKGYGNFGYLSSGSTRELANREDKREYWAMGDNSYNSSDSRYWGAVPERNLVGPGLFCYFPLGRNWGIIW